MKEERSENVGLLKEKIKHQQAMLETLMAEKYEPIAVVGVSLRFPGGCNDIATFATMLMEGREAIAEIPRSRWDNSRFYDVGQNKAGKICTHSGGYIDDFDQFDPKFFSISPKEANSIDPQQRLMLELTWEALEYANINPQDLRGTRAGVYVGISTVDYTREIMALPHEALLNQLGTGTANSAVSGRVAYCLGLRGPCMSVDTACSSSLVAIHLAVNGLRNKEASIAICGGMNIIHHPSSHIIFSHANMLSQDGRCKTFDESADGYGRSEGAAVAVLKRLSDAVRDNDNILAVLRGSAVLQDGESGGLTVPNGHAQEAVMRAAITNSMLQPSDINYVEAHGTGTPLGDPIEIHSINQVFGEYYTKRAPLTVASVKTNVGHMEAAAGMGGLLKVITQMQASEFFPHLNLRNPSKHIRWDELSLDVPLTRAAWIAERKRALINSFGFAGTVSSLIVEEAPYSSTRVQEPSIGPSLVTLSAKTPLSLGNLVRRHMQRVAQLDESEIPTYCYTTNVGRYHFPYRLCALVENKKELSDFLQQSGVRLDARSDIPAGSNDYRNHNIAFLFTGQGSQYMGMGAGLYIAEPCFRQHVDQCDALFQPHLEVSIRDLILNKCSDGEVLLDETLYTQPALFAIEYALAQLWLAWGVRPSVLIGHSIGEVVAACVAGLFSLEDAVHLVATRARLMQSVGQSGAMVAVQARRESMQSYVEAYSTVSFGAFNAPEQCVLSGCTDALQKICTQLEREGINFKKLKVSHAFHSMHMEEVFPAFRDFMQSVQFQEPQLTFISNISGQPAKFDEVATADYWIDHIRQPVNFAGGMQAIERRGKHIFLELGPNPFLTSLGKQCVSGKDNIWLYSLKKGMDDLYAVKNALSDIYKTGQNIDWKSVHRYTHHRKLHLPLYPFDRKRYWLTAAKQYRALSAAHLYHPLLGTVCDSEGDSRRFMATVSPEHPAYLGDHTVMGRIVFPGTAYIEIILALQDQLFGHTGIAIENFYIHEPMFLSNDQDTQICTQLEKKGENYYGIEIFSGEVDTPAGKTRRHVSCNLDLSATFDKQQMESLSNLFSGENRTHTFDKGLMYQHFADKGLNYGPLFRKTDYVAKIGDDAVYGKLAAPVADALEYLNPALMDGVLHTMVKIVPPGKTLLPVGIKKFWFLKKPRNQIESLVKLRGSANNGEYDITADMLMVDSGEPVFYAEGLGLKEIKSTASKPESDFLYQQKWIRSSLDENDYKEIRALWIGKQPFCEAAAVIEEYADAINCVETVEQADRFLTDNPHCSHIVYFWQLTAGEGSIDILAKNGRINYQAVLGLVRLLEEKYFSREIKLIFVTSGAQVLPDDNQRSVSLVELQQSTLWGFCTVLNNEYAKFKARMIDFDPAPLSPSANYEALLRELFLGDDQNEYQIALRQNKRFIRRLEVLKQEPMENFKLDITEYGTFANIEKQPVTIQPPVGDQIQVRVCAAGVNFKDILNVLGMLKQHAVDSGQTYQPLPLGFECAGVVLACGESTQFKPGDEVIISQLGCMQKIITVSSQVVVRKPANISFEQAAAIPTAYITSYYALHRMADMQAGDKVLIHAAAGGVGQASVQLARRAGAEIFATASQSKWRFLQEQGIEHVMNSRDLTFADYINAHTGNKGVDIVLNSLNKEFIPAGLNVVSQGGRFVEIGKIGAWSAEQVGAQREDIAYYHFDLSEMPTEQLNRVNKEILECIVECLEKKEIAPLPVTAFNLDELEEAFAVLSRGKNIGKVVLSFEEDNTIVNHKTFEINPRDYYLITGGYGALGIKAAQWLGQQGARHIALIGRSRPDEQRMAEIRAEIGNDGLRLTCLQGDIGNRQDVEAVFTRLNQGEQRLAGIMHAAGVLADAPIRSQRWEHFEKVFVSKVVGTWLLHEAATQYQPLDFFIGYSSVASVAGSAAQANYAAANAFIDSVMTWRAASGEQGLAVNWGPWSDIGMAANLDAALIASIEEKGMKFIQPAKAMNVLMRLNRLRMAQAIVGEYHWPKYHASLPNSNNLYRNVIGRAIANNETFDISVLTGLPFMERQQQIQQMLRKIVAKILQFEDAREIEPDAKFSELGLDSLVAVELKNVLEKTFGATLQASVIFDYPAIPSLAQHIGERAFAANGREQDTDRPGRNSDIKGSPRLAVNRQPREKEDVE